MDPPEDDVFKGCTHLTIVPAADAFGNSHGVFAQCICSRPGLIEYFLGDMVFSLILVCASASCLNIRPEEGEKQEHLEHDHCYHALEYRWVLFLARSPMIARLVLDNDPINTLPRRYYLRRYCSLEPYCLFLRKVLWQTSKKIADSVNVQLATKVRVRRKTQ